MAADAGHRGCVVMRRLEAMTQYSGSASMFEFVDGEWHEIRGAGSCIDTDSLHEAVSWAWQHSGPEYDLDLRYDCTKMIITKRPGERGLRNMLAPVDASLLHPPELDDFEL